MTADPAAGARGADDPAAAAPSERRRWLLFTALAATVVVADQLAKALVTTQLRPGQSVDVIGDLVRIVFGQNTGALFGLFKDNAVMFGLVSIAVIGLIVAYHWKAAAGLYLTITLGLLLGGAIGNMLDRLRLGYVVDFVDAGLGSLRFYTFNVADSAISLAILLLLIAALRPSLVDGHAPAPAPRATADRSATDDEADAAFWADGAPPSDRAGS
ncbi:MAG TPA: signal peptidase II [Candidatus Limnocylindrales bacterium]|nr:signal peptidase II [Candidatus Limnocylindrales bacterium]